VRPGGAVTKQYIEQEAFTMNQNYNDSMTRNESMAMIVYQTLLIFYLTIKIVT
jgi:hypothetical protein